MDYNNGRDLKIWMQFNNLSLREAGEILGYSKDEINRIIKDNKVLKSTIREQIHNSNNCDATLDVPESYIDAFNYLERQGRV